MDTLYAWWARLVVLARSLPGRVVPIAALVVAFADELARVMPAEPAEDPMTLVVQIASVVTAVVVLVRNLTPAKPAEAGSILPVTTVRSTSSSSSASADYSSGTVSVLGGSTAERNAADPPGGA